jgi:transcriptional regulator with XRE-family HTH domain
MNRLKELRKNNKLNSKKIACDVGISQSYYYELEKGIKRLNDELLYKFAEYYSCTVDYVLGYDIQDIDEVNKNIQYTVKQKHLLSIYDKYSELITPQEIEDILKLVLKAKSKSGQ